jgi:uncharacterized damage-inducible protein DinB
MQPTLDEFRNEAAATKRLLDRVPADKLNWRPHPKSMSLGQLAIHIANVPGRMSQVLLLPQFEVNPANFEPQPPKDLAEIHAAFEQSCAAAEAFLAGLSPEAAKEEFRLFVNGKARIVAPRAAVVRSIMLNHVYHHRGQLTVYLRLLEVPVPATYGRSADENPFA